MENAQIIYRLQENLWFI